MTVYFLVTAADVNDRRLPHIPDTLVDGHVAAVARAETMARRVRSSATVEWESGNPDRMTGKILHAGRYLGSVQVLRRDDRWK